MSRVSFNYGKRHVVAGWDRPLSEYFLTVTGEDEEVEWTSIYSPSSVDRVSTHRLQEVLEFELEIEAPETFWGIVDRREGNVSYCLEGDKWIKRDW